MAKLDKFCLFTPMKVFGVSIIISLLVFAIYSLFFMRELTMEEIRGRHGEGDFSNLLILGGCIIYSIFCSICSYTIYLNLYNTVRENIWLSLLTFYSPMLILPLLALLVWSANDGLLALRFMFFAIPFLIPQTYYFIRFRKRLTSGEILDDFYYQAKSEENIEKQIIDNEQNN